MYIWRLWGDVWEVGDASDYWVYQFSTVLLWLVILSIISIVWVTVWGPYKLISLAFGASFARGDTPLISAPQLESCPHCGNTNSLDIEPCIRCGKPVA